MTSRPNRTSIHHSEPNWLRAASLNGSMGLLVIPDHRRSHHRAIRRTRILQRSQKFDFVRTESGPSFGRRLGVEERQVGRGICAVTVGAGGHAITHGACSFSVQEFRRLVTALAGPQQLA